MKFLGPRHQLLECWLHLHLFASSWSCAASVYCLSGRLDGKIDFHPSWYSPFWNHTCWVAWQRSSTKLSWNTKGGHAFWISPSKKSRSSCHLTPTSWLFMGIFDLRWLWINWRWKETCSRTITIVASTDLFLQSWIKRCFLCLQLLRISAMHCFTIDKFVDLLLPWTYLHTLKINYIPC